MGAAGQTRPRWAGAVLDLINPYGDAPIHYGSGSIKYLLGADKATAVRSLVDVNPRRTLVYW